MRATRILIAGAMVLIPAVAAAQQAPPLPIAPVGHMLQALAAAPPQVPGAAPAAEEEEEEEPYVSPPKNSFNLGLRGTNVTGDRARYERYRDLGDGLFFDGFRLHRQTSTQWFLDAAGDHVGRRDQRFWGSVVLPGKLKITGQWDQLPTLMSTSTRTLFTATSPDALTIDDTLQARVQASASALRGIAENDTTLFRLDSRRHIGQGKLEYIATPDLTFTQSFRLMDRTGAMPYGGAWGHGNFSETFAPVDHRLADWNGNGEYVRGPVLFRAGYVASYFNNEYESFTFDNPFRAVDAASASSIGRSSLPPSNSLFSVNGLASVKMPGRTRASAYVSIGVLKNASGTDILPQTINTANLSRLAPLPRTTVDGEGRTSSVNLTFTSRPVRYLDFGARFRSYEYDNRTPIFSSVQRVSYDNAVSNLAEPLSTEPFGVDRNNLDLDARVIPNSLVAAGVGYSRLEESRTLRIFHATTENVARFTFDSVKTSWFSVRTKYEHSEKRGSLDEEHYEEFVALPEQPGLMHFDIAPRDRDRATVIASVMALENVSLNVSAAAGRDDYVESRFGLRENKHRVYSAGFDAAPAERVTLSALYTFEWYRGLSRSRDANSLDDMLDEARDWALYTTDRVHTVFTNVDVKGIAEKVDVGFSLDVSRARAIYDYVLRPVSSLKDGLNPLPANRNELTRGTVDALYALTPRIGIGVTYWREQFRVADFTLDEASTPTLNLANSLLLGYLYRPYTANTFWGRMVYRW